MPSLKPYLSVHEVAELLGVSEQLIRKYIRQGRLPAYKFGSRTLIDESDVASLLQPIRPAGNDVS